jgi:hypothetical protein
LKDLHGLPITKALIAGLLPENLVIENLVIENLAIENLVIEDQAIENLAIAEVQIEVDQGLQEAVLVAKEMICAMRTEE